MKLINFHTHNYQCKTNSICIESVDYIAHFNPNGNSFYTLGIHPWSSDNANAIQSLNLLKEHLNHPNVIGIGEIGLDRLKGASLDKQIELLIKQLDIAVEANLPVVLHCVRCWSEIISIFKKPKYKNLTKAIHGFRSKPEIAKELINENFYLSFGTSLIDATPELAEALTITPPDKRFFETDDKNIPIYEVYDAAADFLDTTFEQLVSETNSNLKSFFKETLKLQLLPI